MQTLGAIDSWAAVPYNKVLLTLWVSQPTEECWDSVTFLLIQIYHSHEEEPEEQETFKGNKANSSLLHRNA